MYHWTLGGKKLQSHFFFPFFELYQSEYHCYSKIVSLVLFGGTRLAMSAVSDTRWPVTQSVSQWVSQSGVGWGSVHWVPLCCGLLGVRRQPHSTALPPGLHLTLPQSGKKSSSSRTDQSRFSATHGISTGGPPPLDPAVVLPSPPTHPISQFFDTKITLAGRSNSHISGIFASVLCIFWKRSFDFIFFLNVLYCYFCLHAVVYKILAAELALHCSYAETLWSEVPLYVHPVYWMQNEDQYYRPLLIVYLFLTDHALVFDSIL